MLPLATDSSLTGSPRKIIDRLVDLAHGKVPNYSRIAFTLQRLSQRLSAYFAQEEQGGNHCEIIARAPWLAVSVRRLRDEHEELLRQVGQMQRYVRLGGAPLTAALLRVATEQFAESFQEHETAELYLLQDSCESSKWGGL